MTNPHPITPQDVVAHYAPRDANISPDGRYVAFTVRRSCKNGTPELPGEIWLSDVERGTSRRLTYGPATDQHPRWSPDGSRIAFLSDRAVPGQRQIYVIGVDGGEARAITQHQGALDWPTWSPDGKEIAFVCQQAEPTPLSGSDHAIEDADPRYLRLWAVNVQSGALRAITPDGYQVHEFAWSPDGARFAVVAKQGDSTPSGWYTAPLYIAAANGSGPMPDDTVEDALIENLGMTLLCSPGRQPMRQICAITWSPDSKQIAYLTSAISDQPLWSGNLCLISADGGNPVQVTPSDLPLSICKLNWLEPDRMIYSARQLDGTSFGWLTLNAAHNSAQVESLWSGYALLDNWTVPQISVTPDGQAFAAIVERPDTPGQVYTGWIEAVEQPWKLISAFEYTPLQLGRMERTSWQAEDGLEIVGHIIYPVGYEPGKRYPTFVQVHGGPSWGWLPHYLVWWEWWGQYLAGRGYLILLPNIRGSAGRGTAYTEMNIGDMGGGDWRDVLSGVDALIERGLADPDRLGIGGWSYGGFMTAWAISQTTRFKAAIMGAGITNWESYFAQNSIEDWQTVFFGSTPYEDPAAHRALSPLTTIRQARTPTLILHGQEDHDVSLPQAYEMYNALKAQGVETQLVTYPRENHPILERQHQIDLLTRVAEWCDRYMK